MLGDGGSGATNASRGSTHNQTALIHPTSRLEHRRGQRLTVAIANQIFFMNMGKNTYGIFIR
jgi:hypothetical protein